MASVPVKRLGEVEHGLEISPCRCQVQFRYDTVSDILFRYVIGRGETGAFENGELRIENCFVWREGGFSGGERGHDGLGLGDVWMEFL